MPAPWFAPAAATPSSASRSTASLAVEAGERLGACVECEHREDGQGGHAPNGLDRRFELLELEERLDGEEVHAASLEHRRLLGEDLDALLLRDARVTERPDRAGDEDVAAGHLAGVAGELDCGAVDLRQLVFEVLRCELAAICSERVRLDHVRAGLDEAHMELDDGFRRAQVRLFRDAHARGCARDEDAHAAVGDERGAGCEPFEEAVGHRRSLLPASGWETGLALCGHRAHLHRISAVAPHPRGPVAAASQGRVPQPLVMGEASLASAGEDPHIPTLGWGRDPPATHGEFNR